MRKISAVASGVSAMLFDWWYHEGGQLYYAPRQSLPEDSKRASEVAGLYHVGPDIPAIDYGPILATLPIVDMMKRVNAPPNEWAEFVRHNVDLTDPWWETV